MLTGLGVATRQVRQPGDLVGLDAVVIPGGESSTMSLLAERSGLLDSLADRLGAGLPAFGTCAGAILLGREILDGRPDQRCLGVIDIAVRRNAYGRQVDSFEEPLTVVGLDSPLVGAFIRAPVIESVGPTVEVLSEIDAIDGARQPVLCRERTITVCTFHPELGDDTRLHEMFIESI